MRPPSAVAGAVTRCYTLERTVGVLAETGYTTG